MRAKKDENGFMSLEQMNVRFINVLQLVYMNASLDKNGDYILPNDVMQKVETELDFNTNESSKSKIISDQIKRYRKRKSYLFWYEILTSGNFKTYDEAKDILMMIHKKSDANYNSMTHVRYAMETMHLALDDYFGTNKLKVTPNRFLTRKSEKRKNKNSNKGSKTCKKKKLIKKSATTKKSNLSLNPF